jgi:formylglycine-generating enzyme required for sulfatase activity
MKSSCCTPLASHANATVIDAPSVPQASAPNLTGLLRLEGGSFLMGSESPEAWPQDGEGPVREVVLPPFWISPTTVTNAEFLDFVAATDYRTEAERFGWSFVHHSQLKKTQRSRLAKNRVTGLEWWFAVEGATWWHPFGDERDVETAGLLNHPVVHVSWSDAAAYASWRGLRLPTEAEWEYAARGGLVQKTYPWGDELTPAGKHMCNIWQGVFPKKDTGADGYRGTAPVRTFEPNAYGMHNMVGNVWEWAADWFHPSLHRAQGNTNLQGPPFGERRVLRGGSYLCHVSYCNRYRCSARTANTPDSSTGHIGFRVASS